MEYFFTLKSKQSLFSNDKYVENEAHNIYFSLTEPGKLIPITRHCFLSGGWFEKQGSIFMSDQNGFGNFFSWLTEKRHFIYDVNDFFKKYVIFEKHDMKAIFIGGPTIIKKSYASGLGWESIKLPNLKKTNFLAVHRKRRAQNTSTFHFSELNADDKLFVINLVWAISLHSLYVLKTKIILLDPLTCFISHNEDNELFEKSRKTFFFYDPFQTCLVNYNDIKSFLKIDEAAIGKSEMSAIPIEIFLFLYLFKKFKLSGGGGNNNDGSEIISKDMANDILNDFHYFGERTRILNETIKRKKKFNNQKEYVHMNDIMAKNYFNINFFSSESFLNFFIDKNNQINLSLHHRENKQKNINLSPIDFFPNLLNYESNFRILKTSISINPINTNRVNKASLIENKIKEILSSTNYPDCSSHVYYVEPEEIECRYCRLNFITIASCLYLLDSLRNDLLFPPMKEVSFQLFRQHNKNNEKKYECVTGSIISENFLTKHQKKYISENSIDMAINQIKENEIKSKRESKFFDMFTDSKLNFRQDQFGNYTIQAIYKGVNGAAIIAHIEKVRMQSTWTDTKNLSYFQNKPLLIKNEKLKTICGGCISFKMNEPISAFRVKQQENACSLMFVATPKFIMLSPHFSIKLYTDLDYESLFSALNSQNFLTFHQKEIIEDIFTKEFMENILLNYMINEDKSNKVISKKSKSFSMNIYLESLNDSDKKCLIRKFTGTHIPLPLTRNIESRNICRIQTKCFMNDNNNNDDGRSRFSANSSVFSLQASTPLLIIDCYFYDICST